jgi:hypothetical protein
MLLFALISSSLALAGPFTERSSMGEWPETQLQRDFVLPRGWLQLGLGVATRASTAWRDETGQLIPYDDGTRFRHSSVSLEIDQGFSKRISLYARIPLVTNSLINSRGADISTSALGDIHTGLVVQPWLRRTSILAFSADVKAPSGLEWPADMIGGPSSTSGFLTGTGVTNLGLFLHFRHRILERTALTLQAGQVFKFPAIVGYVLEEDGWGLGWLDPGDESLLLGELSAQVLGDLSVSATCRYSYRGVYAMGTKGPGTDAPDLDPLAGSNGAFLDVGGSLSYEPTRHLEFAALASAQILGPDTRLFASLGLEEFSPQPGLTLGGKGVIRW